MEIKSYIKQIQQKPITPPPIEQKCIQLDVTFDEFRIILASLGVAETHMVANWLHEHTPIGESLPRGVSAHAYSLFSSIFDHARKAGIIRDYK
jgi:hypothetical protein